MSRCAGGHCINNPRRLKNFPLNGKKKKVVLKEKRVYNIILYNQYIISTQNNPTYKVMDYHRINNQPVSRVFNIYSSFSTYKIFDK